MGGGRVKLNGEGLGGTVGEGKITCPKMNCTTKVTIGSNIINKSPTSPQILTPNDIIADNDNGNDWDHLSFQGVLHLGSLRTTPSFGSRMIKEREEEETCICAPVVIGKRFWDNYVKSIGLEMSNNKIVLFYFLLKINLLHRTSLAF